MPAGVSFRLSSLTALGVWALQVSPALHDLPVGDPPNHNPGELQPLLRCRIRSSPVIADHHFVVLDNHVFYRHTQVRNFLERGAPVLGRPFWSRSQSGRDIRPVFDKAWREIRLTDAQVLPVHEFLKVIADEFFISVWVIPVLGFLNSDVPAAEFILPLALYADAA
jgi:hypothetical protein